MSHQALHLISENRQAASTMNASDGFSGPVTSVIGISCEPGRSDTSRRSYTSPCSSDGNRILPGHTEDECQQWIEAEPTHAVPQ